MYKRAIFPGTFDPFTLGHLSLVERGLLLFDEIIIAIGVNPDKRTMFSPDERLEMISRVLAKESRIRVCSYEGLTIDLAEKENAGFILRGIRTASDFDYERTVAKANRKLSGIETVILFAEPEREHISSSVVRELLSWKKPVDDFVPAGMFEATITD
ncbi:MAG: pantetheine-phosphate adenylyltransferase [Dysgonamonadaceae bacterium]|jgi:pantetheine-phosphate adenylyltransferase|nr:pantetheine-phosphate adenylyltransferase [Dysgonamonadaceae bacterium]